MSLKPEELMRKALELAAIGWPNVAPNPMVGALVIHRDRIVARGYHKKFGEAHAEVMAITYIPSDIDPKECELYVTLEPCDHYGKTPPCTELILQSGLKKVTVSGIDPNPLVGGKGIKRLREAGVEVETGLLEPENRLLNRRFITFHEKKRPYITLKWAQSNDGYISRLPVPKTSKENRISGPEAMRFAHKLRAESMAIMVGKQTVLADNPELSTRLVKGRNPVRLFIDPDLEIPRSAAIYNKKAKTLIFNKKTSSEQGHLSFIRLDFEKDVLQQIMEILYQEGIQSLLVEGGSRLLNSFFERDLYEEVLVVKNPELQLYSGVDAPRFELPAEASQTLGSDLLYRTLRFV